jgi:uncharacterized membrane protein YcaP (DUF421 family)
VILDDLFVTQVPLAEKVLRTVAVYLLIVLLFRVSGKRGMASLNTFDFVVVFLLSNVVQNAVIGADNSLFGGAVGAVTLVTCNAVFNRFALVSPRARRLLEGSPTTVISDGKPDVGSLRRLGMRTEELDHAVRLQNGDAVGEVANAELEPGGQLVITLRPAMQDADKGDVAEILRRLETIEGLLSSRSPGR